jgi:hypothetical protein
MQKVIAAGGHPSVGLRFSTLQRASFTLVALLAWGLYWSWAVTHAIQEEAYHADHT